MPRYIVAYAPPTLWAAFIFFLSNQSLLPSFEVSTADFLFKKVAHMFVYAVLFLLLHRAGSKTQLKGTRAWIVPVALSVLYAVSDEIHQSFVPGRAATLRDIGYDMMGVLVAFLQRYRYI